MRSISRRAIVIIYNDTEMTYSVYADLIAYVATRAISSSEDDRACPFLYFTRRRYATHHSA